MLAVLTRAREDAARSAARLAARSVETILLPVLETATLPLAAAPPVDFLLATSRRAFPALSGLPEAARAGLTRAPIYVVGPATAAAAREAGFAEVRVAQGDAASMLDLLALTGARGRALYLAGRDRKPALEEGLSARGVEVAVAVAYEARARDWDAGERRAARAAAGAGAVALHYSARSARLFLDQLDAAGLAARLGDFCHIAMSQDAAGPIRDRGSRVVWPARPSEDDLFALLRP